MKRNSLMGPGLLICCLVAIHGCASSEKIAAIENDDSVAIVSSDGKEQMAESMILDQLSTMLVGTSIRVHNQTCVAGVVYTAASGRHCRIVEISITESMSIPTRRVACKSEQGWFFTNDVLYAGYGSN